MFHKLHRLAFLVLAMLVALRAVRAADVTDHIPSDALGFVVVRDMASTNDKLQKLIRMFEAPLPAPLDFFKLQTGFGEGFREDGDMALVLLPALDAFGSPGPLALVPVTDYAAFVGTFNGDPSGEICPVTVSQEDVLVAKAGDYALFMNPEYRDQMQRIVAAEPKTPESVTALDEWLSANNGTLVLMPAGAKLLVTMANQGMAEARQQMERNFQDLGQQQELASMLAAFEVFNKLLGFLGDEVTAAALGVAIDDASNIKLGIRAVAKEGGRVSQLGPIARTSEPLADVPAGPFVVAGGGPGVHGISDAMMQLSLDLMKSMPALYGTGDISEEDMQKLVETSRKAMGALKHVSFVMRPGEGDDPLYSNIYVAALVDNAPQYVEQYRESTGVWREIAAKAKGGQLPEYELSEETIAGKPGILVTIDVSAGVAAQGVPQAQLMMRRMFGEDGKMRFYVAQVDETRVVVCYSAKSATEALVESLRKNETPLANDAAISTTAALLPADASFAAYISPQGCVAWVSRMMSVMMGVFGGGPTIPEFPATPPVGVAVGLDGRMIETDVVFPTEMLEGLNTYIQQNR